MSLLREFSVRRRRAGLMDVITPDRTVSGITGYTFEWATNFDAVYNAIITNKMGFLDTNPTTGIPQAVLDPMPGRNHRFVFNPATFSIPDAGSFWLRMKQINAAGVTVATSPGVLVLPESERHARLRVVIQGNAPNAATIAGSLQIYLPFGAANLFVQNQEPTGTGKALYLAMNVLGPETVLAPDNLPEFPTYEGVVDQLVVRGDSATVAFSAHFDYAAPA